MPMAIVIARQCCGLITCGLHQMVRAISAAVAPTPIVFSVAPTPIVFSLLYSTRTQTQQNTDANAITKFLVDECGLSPAEVTKVMRVRPSLFRNKHIQNFQQVAQLLTDSGFTKTQLKRVIVGNPSFLSQKADGQFKEKIQLMKSLGLIGQDLGRVISRVPRVLSANVDNVTVKISHLENLFGSKDSFCKALKKGADILTCDVERHLGLLKQHGVQGELLLILMTRRPTILTNFSTDFLESKIKYVKNMGIVEGSKAFVYALEAVISCRSENLEKKMMYISSIGLLEEEVHKIFQTDPTLLQVSTNKMQQNMDFLVRTAGLPPKIVASYPGLLKYSLEKRLKPRYEVFKYLREMEHAKRHLTLRSLFVASEKSFVEKIVKCSSEAANLYETCKAKSRSTTIPEFL